MDLVQESATFPSITMDEKVLLDMLLMKLRSVVNIARALNMEAQLRKLEFFLRSADEYYFYNAEKLKLFFYDAELVIDEYEVWSLQNRLLPSSTSSKIRGFFSYIAYRIRLWLEIRKLVKKLDKIGGHPMMVPQCSIGPYRARGLMHARAFVHYSGIVGRDIDRDKVVEMLLKSGNEATLFVLPIVGVGGIGKTTLAKLVYNDPRIVSHFQLRSWAHVSRVFKVDKLLEQIVESVREDICENLDMNELQNLVQETLYEKNYLIVLDDVWNEDPVKWDELKKLLMVGACGSKILVTTRLEEVASMMGTVPAYCLKGLLSEACLTLFLRKAFERGQSSLYPNLIGIAPDIVQKCEGNPLVLEAVGSSLYKKTEESLWNQVKNHWSWNSNQYDTAALRMIYDELPSNLKVFLAYCSIFPKGSVIEIDKLIQLWVAEGLISQSSNDTEDPEAIGIRYFQELLSRSFFRNVEEYRSVFTSICKLHDLVHDLALSAAGVEFCTVNSHTQNFSDEVRHVAFSDYDLSGKELPASLLNNQALRTISFSVDGIGPMSTLYVENCIARFMQLRVLDMSDSCFDELPSSIGELKYLRYLDISANGSIKELPDSINKLLSLQTLRVSHCAQLEGLPKDIGNLISLRHLHITTKQACFPDKAIGCLSSLRSLFIYSCNNLVSLSEGLQHLTSLRTLAIIGCPRLTFFPSAMKHLTALENLLIVDCEELTLLEWQDIEGLRMLRSLVIGGLPELESKDVQCLRNLQMLVLAGLPELVTLPRWLEGANSTLQYLRVERCPNFAALPKWLENLTSLEKLEIFKCSTLFSSPKGMSCLSNLKVLLPNLKFLQFFFFLSACFTVWIVLLIQIVLISTVKWHSNCFVLWENKLNFLDYHAEVLWSYVAWTLQNVSAPVLDPP
ncbi:disease resistance protein RGA2-like [Lycium barbarum]|uniref:disease resistance protein RGA2-like n=1 Tax=Lycium barbarum TaxID=112863 RepID=UPI00293E4E0D|nr:disease resistance protein RGA2-like [Lycium barbarum]